MLGPSHPHVAGSLNGLANLYLDQGKYGDAQPLYRRALLISEKALGPAHPDVGQALMRTAMADAITLAQPATWGATWSCSAAAVPIESC